MVGRRVIRWSRRDSHDHRRHTGVHGRWRTVRSVVGRHHDDGAGPGRSETGERAPGPRLGGELVAAEMVNRHVVDPPSRVSRTAASVSERPTWQAWTRASARRLVRLTPPTSSPGGPRAVACSSPVHRIRRGSAHRLRWCRSWRRWPHASSAAPSPSEASCASTRSSGSPNTPARSASSRSRPHELWWCNPALAHGRRLDRALTRPPGRCRSGPCVARIGDRRRRVGRHRPVGLVEARSRARPARRSGRPADRDAPGGRERRAPPATAVSVRWFVVPSHAGRRPGRAGHVRSKTRLSSISARCGRAHCAVRCWPSAGFASSRSSRHGGPTAPGADRRRSSTG